jgi:hypothetical protein
VNELNGRDKDKWREACQILVKEFHSLASVRFVLFCDESAIYISDR